LWPPTAGPVVELVNPGGQTIRSAHSAFDGYYLLDSVVPDSYRIRAADSGLAGRNLHS
jgi:hypothetical protein